MEEVPETQEDQQLQQPNQEQQAEGARTKGWDGTAVTSGEGKGVLVQKVTCTSEIHVPPEYGAKDATTGKIRRPFSYGVC